MPSDRAEKARTSHGTAPPPVAARPDESSERRLDSSSRASADPSTPRLRAAAAWTERS